MNQAKYLVYALLLLLFFSFIVITVDKISSAEFISKKPAGREYVEAGSKAIVINSAGKTIFQNNCQTCHALDKTVTGPALRGVESRGPWVDRKNIITWVKNPAGTINRFDYTKKLVAEFGGQIMPSFTQLTDKEIEAIFDYITKAPVPGYTPIVAIERL